MQKKSGGSEKSGIWNLGIWNSLIVPLILSKTPTELLYAIWRTVKYVFLFQDSEPATSPPYGRRHGLFANRIHLPWKRCVHLPGAAGARLCNWTVFEKGFHIFRNFLIYSSLFMGTKKIYNHKGYDNITWKMMTEPTEYINCQTF